MRFILPSLVQRGDLAITIGTGGKSPALARHLREELEARYGKEYEIFLNILGNLRVKMVKNEGIGKIGLNLCGGRNIGFYQGKRQGKSEKYCP